MNVCYRLSELNFRYTDDWILQNFDLQVVAGEVLGLIGPNGSGKTSLLKLLAGLLQPAGGTIELYGKALQQFSAQELARKVAMVPQETQILFPFTVADIVLMGRFVHQNSWGWESAEDVRIVQDIMQMMEVHHLANRTFQELSGGERQRAIIARALAQEPRILLLDEPTAFLDIKHQIDIFEILKRLNRDQGVTVVIVSHDLNQASQHCDRLLLLHESRAFQVGSPEQVLTVDHIRAVYHCDVLIDRHPMSGTPRITLPQCRDDSSSSMAGIPIEGQHNRIRGQQQRRRGLQ